MKKESQKENTLNKDKTNENKDNVILGSACHIGVEETMKRLIKNFPKK